MLLALASAVVVAVATPAAPTDRIDDGIAAFSRACLQVRGDRDKLAAAAEGMGLTPFAIEPRDGHDWVDAFRGASLAIRLHHIPAQSSPTSDSSSVSTRIPEQLICAVDVPDVSGDWRAALEALTVDGAPLGAGREPGQDYVFPDEVEILIWDLADGSRIHGSYIAADRYLELSVNYPAGF